MCGFVGLIGPAARNVEPTFLISSISHRGPDHQASYTSGNFFVAASVLNTVPGKEWHQPLFDSNGHVLCFNGVIYNIRNIVNEYLPNAVDSSAYCDSKLVFELLVQCGMSILDLFDGMFALAWKDGDSLFLARDRFGIKPLHVARGTASGVIFASELKAIKASMSASPLLNLFALAETLVFDFPLGQKTLLDEIDALEPGSCWKYSINDPLQIPKLVWRVADQKQSRPIQESLNFELVADSVAQCVIGLTNAGMLLSGGTDSALIAMALPEALKSGFRSIFLSYPDDYDEYGCHLLLATSLGLLSHRHSSEGDFSRNLVESIYAVERPLIQSSSFVAGKFAKSLGIRCLLTGDGADELFDGYPLAASPDIFVARYQNRLNNLRDLPMELRAPIQTRLEEIESDPDSLEAFIVGDQLAYGQCELIDKGLMHSGIEARFPYLSARMIPGFFEAAVQRRTGKKAVLSRIAEERLPHRYWAELTNLKKRAAKSIQANHMSSTLRIVRELEVSQYFDNHPMKWLTKSPVWLLKLDIFAQQFGLCSPRITEVYDLWDVRNDLFDYYENVTSAPAYCGLKFDCSSSQL